MYELPRSQSMNMCSNIITNENGRVYVGINSYIVINKLCLYHTIKFEVDTQRTSWGLITVHILIFLNMYCECRVWTTCMVLIMAANLVAVWCSTEVGLYSQLNFLVSMILHLFFASANSLESFYNRNMLCHLLLKHKPFISWLSL